MDAPWSKPEQPTFNTAHMSTLADYKQTPIINFPDIPVCSE